MKKTIHSVFLVLIIGLSNNVFAQTTLEADGPGNTYELINSVLAPGFDVIETPECIHPEFGRHIAEVWDADLGRYVFEFYIHVQPDNDRCINFDRQRVEIKTYDKSPANLVGVTGESIVYKWKFKIPIGFQPSTSFTHIHQIKAVGGDESDPIFTLTVRKATPNRIELIHDNKTRLTTANLSLFEGVWVEAEERVQVDSLHGTYSISIKKLSDGTPLLSYSNTNLMTIRYNNSFIRPKWGIYRSLNSPSSLRDEALRFSGFSIYEEPPTAIGGQLKLDGRFEMLSDLNSNEIRINYTVEHESNVQLEILRLNGRLEKMLVYNDLKLKGNYKETFDVSSLADGFYFIRLKAGNYADTAKLIIKKNANKL
ncbi:MAG TPA: T9SS type A sorting domain-containing protein [Bacteroidales bacterium]|nr:T9SS type A sorting domain-containing protein [Bacteroidales bacterium]